MGKIGFNLEKPDAVFFRVPVIHDICVEFGVGDAETVTCMYELFKRVTEKERVDISEESYDDGYKAGYNDGVEEAARLIDDLSWEVDRLKKN